MNKDFSLKISIEPDKFYERIGKEPKYNLLTCSNGYQWSGGGLLTIDELKQVADEIYSFIDKNKAKQ